MCFFQCFNTISWVTGGHHACKKHVLWYISPNYSLLELVQEENTGENGQPRLIWRTAVKIGHIFNIKI